MFVVVVTEKGGSQQRIELDLETISIGRIHGNNVVLPRGNVSKKHAAIDIKGDKFFLADLGSTNGTFVNGRRIRDPQEIKPGDKIYVGDFIIHLEIVEPAGIRVPVSDKDQDNTTQTVPVVSEKEEIAPPTGKSARPSSPPPPLTRTSERPTEKRVRVPKLAKPSKIPPPPTSDAPAKPPTPPAQSTPPKAPIPPKRPGGRATSSGFLSVKQLLADASLKLGISELADGQVALVPDKAAKLRRVLHQLTEEAASVETPFPVGHTPASLAAAAFRQAVDLGPLYNWITDPSILEIRVFGTKTAALKKETGWVDVDNPFASEESLNDVVSRLEAGLERHGHRYDLEDGIVVFRCEAPRPGIVVSKCRHCSPLTKNKAPLGEAETAVLKEAIASESKIAVLGRDPSARSAVLSNVVDLIPNTAFVAAVGHNTVKIDRFSKAIRVKPQKREAAENRTAAAIDQACDIAPDWLLIAGISWRNLPEVLAAATSRLAVIAELPIGAVGRINRELSVCLISAGLSTTPGQAALFLDEAFDIIVVAGTLPSGLPCIQHIFASALSDRGSWAPRALYTRESN